MRKNKLLLCAIIWMTVTNIMLSKFSQIQKSVYCVIPLYEVQE